MPNKVVPKRRSQIVFAILLNLIFLISAFYIYSFMAHLYIYEADKDHYDEVTQITHRLEIEFFQNKTHLLARISGKNSYHLRTALIGNKQTQGSLKLLNSIKEELGAAIVYLINPKGDVISSTSFGEGKNLIGDNYSFREYFIEAMKGSSYTFTALGIATKKRGIYYSSPVINEDGTIIGVLVIKLDAEAIDKNLSEIKETVYLVDSRDFIFASNRPTDILRPLNDVLGDSINLANGSEPPKESLFAFNLLKPTEGFDLISDREGQFLYRVDKISMGENSWRVVAIDDTKDFMPKALLGVFALGVISIIAFLNIMLMSYFQIRRSKDIALNANRIKTEFLANMSHEIRTPISGIIGLTDIILGNEELPEDVVKNLRSVQRLGEHLSTIINDILDYSKIEVGKYELFPEVFDIYEFVEQFLVPFRLSASRKGVEIESSISQNCPDEIMLDQKRLHQILTNIVGNALKFTSSGRVSINVTKLANENVLQFVIRDTGIGIDSETNPNLFSPFTQADASTSKVYGGTGLGLSISKRFTELMGGEISYTSTLGVGTSFSIQIPYRVASASGVQKLATTAPTVQKCFSDLRILVVDDNEINLQVAKAIINKFSPKEVVTCTNGKEAIELFQSMKPDLIFMDCQMPLMSGFEASLKIRQMEAKDEHVTIVALTANVMSGDKEECLRAGMDDYLPKPLRKEELGRVVDKYFSTQKV